MTPFFDDWRIWAGLSAVFAALTALFAKVGVAGVPPEFATFVRTVVVVMLSGAIVMATKAFPVALDQVGARAWLFLGLSGLATGLSWLCYFRAISLGEISKVAPVDKLSVVLTALLAWAFIGERIAPLHWLGIALITIGATLLAIRV